MRVLLAPDRFGGVLTAAEAAGALAAGWERQAPADALSLLPLSAGGEGFVGALAAGEVASRPPCAEVPVRVSACDGSPRTATMLLAGAPPRTAYLEWSPTFGTAGMGGGDGGAPDLSSTRRGDDRSGRPVEAVARGTSAGLGELLRAALQAGARRIVVGVGSAPAHDGGAGLLGALGAGPPELLRRGVRALEDLPDDALAGLALLRQELAGVELVAGVPDDLPLLGLSGASATRAAELAATPAEAHELERALSRFAQVAAGAAGLPRRTAGEPGCGAGGGVAFGLRLLGARLVPGPELVAGELGLRARLLESDLVVTGEGRLDWRSLRGGVVAEVAARAMETGAPVVVVAGRVEVGRRDALSIGVESTYAVAEDAASEAALRQDAAAALAARAARVARTWSPPRRQ